MRVEGGSCHGTWPGGSQSGVSQVSRVRAPVMPTGLPTAAPAALPAPAPAPSLTVYLLLEPPSLLFCSSVLPGRQRIGEGHVSLLIWEWHLQQVAPKSFTSFESLTGWNFGSSRAPRSINPPCNPLCASRAGPRLLKKCRCHDIGRMLMVSTLTFEWFYLLNNLMKAPVFGTTNNSEKQKEPTSPIIVGNELMICKLAVCICIL